MISTLDSAALVLAGTVAGLIGSAGGITSLVSASSRGGAPQHLDDQER